MLKVRINGVQLYNSLPRSRYLSRGGARCVTRQITAARETNCIKDPSKNEIDPMGVMSFSPPPEESYNVSSFYVIFPAVLFHKRVYWPKCSCIRIFLRNLQMLGGEVPRSLSLADVRLQLLLFLQQAQLLNFLIFTSRSARGYMLN